MTVVVLRNCVGREVAAPIMLDRRRRRLSSIVRRHADHRRPHIVSVHRSGDIARSTDESVRLRKTWQHTLVGTDDVVVITYLPLGGAGSTGKQIGGALAMMTLALAVPWALGGIPALTAAGGGLSFAGRAAAAGIVCASGMHWR